MRKQKSNAVRLLLRTILVFNINFFVANMVLSHVIPPDPDLKDARAWLLLATTIVANVVLLVMLQVAIRRERARASAALRAIEGPTCCDGDYVEPRWPPANWATEGKEMVAIVGDRKYYRKDLKDE